MKGTTWMSMCPIFDHQCVPLVIFPFSLAFDVFLFFFLFKFFFLSLMLQPRQIVTLLTFFMSSFKLCLFLFNNPYPTLCYWHCVDWRCGLHHTHQRGHGHFCLPSPSIWRYMAPLYVSGLLDKSCVLDYLSSMTLSFFCFCWMFLFCSPQYASVLCSVRRTQQRHSTCLFPLR